MRTKRLKLSDGRAVDAVLLAGGYGANVYGVDNLYIVLVGRIKREYSVCSELGTVAGNFVAYPFTKDETALELFNNLIMSIKSTHNKGPNSNKHA